MDDGSIHNITSNSLHFFPLARNNQKMLFASFLLFLPLSRSSFLPVLEDRNLIFNLTA